jgi:hypothetical protein
MIQLDHHPLLAAGSIGMHMHTLPLISQPDLMPHGSGYISTCGVLLLPRRSDSGSLLWGRLCGTIVLDSVLDSVVPAPQIIITMSMPRGSALGLTHRVSLGEQVDHGFHKNLSIGWDGASRS